MVDINRTRPEDRADVDNDDPFAELARIIGYDPRRNAEQGHAATSVAPPSDTQTSRDLSLDLERELMGEFGLEAADDVPAETIGSPPVEVDASALDDDWLSAEMAAAADEQVRAPDSAFDQHDVAADLETDDEVVDPETGVQGSPEFAPQPERPVQEFDASHDWSASSVDAVEDASPTVAASAFDEPDGQAGYALPETAVAAIDHGRAEREAAAAYEPDGQMDADREMQAFASAHDLSYTPEPDVAWADGSGSAGAWAPHAQSEPPRDVPDQAMAEAFASVGHAGDSHAAAPDSVRETGEVQPQAEALAPAQHELSAQPEPSAQPEMVPASVGSVTEPTPILAAANDRPEPIAVPEPASDGLDDVDLEAELNALLGNSLRPSLPLDAPPPDTQRSENWGAASHDWYNQLYVPPQQDAEPPARAASPFDGRRVIVADNDPVSAAPVSAAPVSLASPSASFASAAMADQSAVVYDASSAEEALDDGEFSPEFDQSAFEAAIENQMVADALAEDVFGDDADAGRSGDEGQDVTKDGRDPYAALAALSAGLQNSKAWAASPVTEMPAQMPGQMPQAADVPVVAPVEEDFPDIDTIDVPEGAVALPDDLDLPAFQYEEPKQAGRAYEDMDEDFSNLLSEMAEIETPPGRPDATQQAGLTGAHASGSEAAAIALPAAVGAVGLAAAHGQGRIHSADDPYAYELDAMTPPGSDPSLADMEDADDPDLDPDAPPTHVAAGTASPRRGLMVAAIVGGVAILGGVGAFALSFGSGGGADEPVLVRADAEPVKVKPTSPGGTTVPNQDNKVYDSVAGSGSTAASGPQQDQLLSSTEEPVDMPLPDDGADVDDETTAADGGPAVGDAQQPVVAGTSDDLPGVTTGTAAAGKSEERLQGGNDQPVDASMEVAAVAPRKVRTMVVRPDGSLVAREDPQPAEPAPVNSASAGVVQPSISTSSSAAVAKDLRTDDPQNETAPAAAPSAAVAPATAPSAAVPAAAPVAAAAYPEGIDQAEDVAPAAPAATAQPAAAPAAAAPAAVARQEASTPSRAPIAPARPSDQPVDIVGEVRAQPQQVAALAAAAPSAGSWAMQIASQPTEDAAQSTYRDLARRYAGVLDGRQAVIMKAEVQGKGTFWRVRVPAGDRAAAIKLCESYKAAGGNCFVSK